MWLVVVIAAADGVSKVSHIHGIRYRWSFESIIYPRWEYDKMSVVVVVKVVAVVVLVFMALLVGCVIISSCSRPVAVSLEPWYDISTLGIR
jgi:hypothetical protein